MRIFACMASSLDGKIGPAHSDQFVSITSPYDMEHLKSLRDESDGILFGAATYRAWPKVHKGHDTSNNPQHFIMSRQLDLDVMTPLFQTPATPLTLFSTSSRAIDNSRFPRHVQLILTPDDLQIPFILDEIRKRGVESLLIEGGGTIIHQFIEAQVLEELYLTVAPKLIGQTNAPGLLGGQTLSRPPNITVLNSQLVDDEIYFHLKLTYP